MQFFLVKTCLVALTAVTSVLAQATSGFDVFTQPSTPGSTVPAGQPYTISWSPSPQAGTVSIVLLQGSSNTTLQMGPTIASAIDGASGSFSWNVPSAGVSYAAYGLKIQLDSDNSIYQYSTYFSISGLSASGSASASTTVTVQVSQVANVTSTVTASLVTVSNSTTAAPSTTSASSISPNSTVILLTTKTTTPATTLATAASSAASAIKSGAAVSNAAIGGTGLLGALLFSLSLLL